MTMTSASARASASRSRSAAVGVSTTAMPAGADTARFAASSVTSAPRRLASSASATPMRPDERFPTKRTASSGSRVPPADTSDALSRQWASPSRSSSTGRRSPRARPCVRLPPRPRRARPPPDRRARRRERGGARRSSCVAGCCPHARVHRRRDEHRAVVRECGLGQDVVGETVRESRERVGRERRDDEEVEPSEVRVRIVARRLLWASARNVSSATKRSAPAVSTGSRRARRERGAGRACRPCRPRSRRSLRAGCAPRAPR